MVTCVDDLISLEMIEPDGYPGWPATAPADQATDDLDWYYADSMLGEAAAFRPIVLMACQMVTNPALKGDLRRQRPDLQRTWPRRSTGSGCGAAAGEIQIPPTTPAG